MPATITITCPECGNKSKGPEDLVGKKVRCKECGATFPVKGPKAAAKPAAKSAPAKPGAKPAAGKPRDVKPNPPDEEDEDGEAKPYGVSTLDLTPRCPNCAYELESEDAVVCLHCGYNTQTRQQFRTRKVQDITFGDRFKWLLPGILCVLAILLLIGGDIFYVMKMQDLVADEWYDFLGGTAWKLWVVIFSLFGMFFAGRYAFIRLVLDNRPPEVEKRK
jgi:hypothetical protein